MTIKILAFDGSGRKGSINRNVLNHVIEVVKGEQVEVTQINLYDYDLPLYNADLYDQGYPDAARRLKELFKSHDAFLVASPEYNGSFSPLLKNTFDWVSRPSDGGKSMEGIAGKIIGIIGASAGKMGGLRGLYHLNTFLFEMGMLVLPEIVSVGFYNDAIDENGKLKNDNDKNAVSRLGKRIVTVAKALK